MDKETENQRESNANQNQQCILKEVEFQRKLAPMASRKAELEEAERILKEEWELELMLNCLLINTAQGVEAVRTLQEEERAPHLQRRKAENKEEERLLLTMIPETMKIQQAKKALENQEEENRKGEPRATT